MSIATEAVKKSEVFEINGMNLWYGEHQALKDIHMKMNKHEVTAIIGPSGLRKIYVYQDIEFNDPYDAERKNDRRHDL